MITLKEFVKETLAQIADAALEFHAERSQDSATPTPKVLAPKIHASGKSCVFVAFDVAVAAEEKDRAGAGVGVKVLSVLNADGTLEKTAASSSHSRVSFDLALYIPDVV